MNTDSEFDYNYRLAVIQECCWYCLRDWAVANPDHDRNLVCCSLHCSWSAVSSERRVEEQLQLLPLSSWLDLMILSEYSDMLEHSIWQKKRKKLINGRWMKGYDILGRIFLMECLLHSQYHVLSYPIMQNTLNVAAVLMLTGENSVW